MTHGVDFKTPKFPNHVIYSRCCLDEENPFMQKNIYVLFWMSNAMFVEAASFDLLLNYIFRLNFYLVDLVRFLYSDFFLSLT